MHTRSINPYALLGDKFQTALDSIGSNLPPDPTFDNLNEQLFIAMFTPDPNNPTPFDGLYTMLQVVLPNTYNAYVNRGTRGNYPYTETQQQFINQTMSGVRSTTATSLPDYLLHREEDLAQAGLTFEEQIPLFVMLALARSAVNYWQTQADNPATVWLPYLSTNPTVNYLNINTTVCATMFAATAAYAMMKKPEIELLDIMLSLVAATGMSAGKVVFGWMEGE